MDIETLAHHDAGDAPKTTKAKRMACVGCNEECSRLYEVVDSLTHFSGDLVCAACAANTASETV